MTVVVGRLYDGATSRAYDAALYHVARDTVTLVVGGQHFPMPLREVKVSPRVGSAARFLRLAGRIKFETLNNDGVDRIFRDSVGKARGLTHILESSYQFVLAALFVLVFGTTLAVVDIIPRLADYLSEKVPHSVVDVTSRNTLRLLDDRVFSPTAVETSRQARISALFESMAAETGLRVELLFRQGNKVGANAFALPNGTIVVTDELLRLAANDQEVLAVLAHELGHVAHHHGTRSILQSSGISLLLAALWGDAATGSLIGASLPVFVLEARYSQHFELEADAFAKRTLTKHRIELQHFANILVRLQQRNETGLPNYLSSHPATKQRLQQLRAAP